MFEYDLAAHAGRASALRPALDAALQEIGWPVQPGEGGGFLLRPELDGVKAPVTLRLGPGDAGVLEAEVHVFKAPAPAPDAFFGSLAAWNAGGGAFTALSREEEADVEVVLHGVLPPRLGGGEPWPAAELRPWLEALVKSKPRLLALLTANG